MHSPQPTEPPGAAVLSAETPKPTPKPFQMSRIGRHSLIYGIGIGASKAVAFLTLPIYTRYLTPADYGVLQLIMMTHEMVSIVAGARIARGIFHFYHKADDPEVSRRVLSTAWWFLGVTYAATSLAMYAVSPAIADFVFGTRGDYVIFLRIAALTLAFEGLVLAPNAYLLLRDRSKLFVSVNLVKLALQLTLNIVLLIPFRMGVLGVLVSSLVTNVALGLFLSGYLLHEVSGKFSTAAARDLTRFGVPLVVMQVASVMLAFGDRYFLNKAGDTAAVGIYGLAHQFGFLLLTVGYLPFAQIWDPVRFEIAKRPDRNEVYARVFVYINVVLITTATSISLFTPDFLRIIANPSFHAASALVPVILIAYLFQSWMAFLNLGVFIRERTEFFTLATWLAAAVAFLGYIWLIPPLLAWGAAITMVLAFSIRTLVVHAFAQKMWPIRYRWGPVLKLLAVAVPPCLVGAFLPFTNIGISLLVRSFLLAAYVVAVWHLNILTESERARILGFVRARGAALSGLKR